jgi:hypothetical protein
MAGSDGFADGGGRHFFAVADGPEFSDIEVAGGKSDGGNGERGTAEPVAAGHVLS